MILIHHQNLVASMKVERSEKKKYVVMYKEVGTRLKRIQAEEKWN